MKTRSSPEEPANIAATVKARRSALLPTCTGQEGCTNSANGLCSGLPTCCGAPGCTGCGAVGTQMAPGCVNVGNGSTVGTAGSVVGPGIVTGSTETKKVEGAKIKTGTKATKLWTPEDKRLFFQSLRLYGKNFNEISRFIRIRCNRPDVSGKTKEQVRIFYHRTLQHIRPFIKVEEDVPSLALELYALINYSVVRSRIKKPLDSRLGEKLNELVQNGTTFVRYNGKHLLRTPICPALKRLNNLKAPSQMYVIPHTVQIEVVPSNQASLLKVHYAEQNPRVRLQVAINRQLSDVITLLENKWKSAAQRIRESLQLPVTDPPRVRLRLPGNVSIDGALHVQEVARTRSVDVSLRAYQERLQQNDKPPNEEENTAVKLDMREIAELLKSGVGLEEARDIKVLVVYIALGCPERLRFEYEYLSSGDQDMMNISISNSLRRLMHLSVGDYMEQKKKKDTRDELQTEIDALRSEAEKLRTELRSMKDEKEDIIKAGPLCEPINGVSVIPQSCGGVVGEAGNGPVPMDVESAPQTDNSVVDQNQERALEQLAGLSKTPIVVQRLGGPHQSSLASVKAFNANRSRLRRATALHNVPPPPLFTNGVQHTPSSNFQANSVSSYSSSSVTYSSQTTHPAPHFSISDSDRLVDGPVLSSAANESTDILDQAYRMTFTDHNNDSLTTFLNDLNESKPDCYHGEAASGQLLSDTVLRRNGEVNDISDQPSNEHAIPADSSDGYLPSGLTTPKDVGASPFRINGSDSCHINFNNFLTSPLKESHYPDSNPEASRESFTSSVARAVSSIINENSNDMFAGFSDLAHHLSENSNGEHAQ